VELSSSVVTGARYFKHVNQDVVAASNVLIRTDDGRNHLLLTTQKYDVIMADVVQPQHAGSAALYSLEYFQLARAVLKPGGLMVQWIDRRLPESQCRLLLRTFLRAFPYATSWVDGAFVIGANEPHVLDRDLVARRLAGSAGGAARSVGLSSVEALRSLHTATDVELRGYAGEGPIVTDDHPYIEFFRSLR
jgi:spermidine synthase